MSSVSVFHSVVMRLQADDKLEKRLHVKSPEVLFKFDLSKKV